MDLMSDMGEYQTKVSPGRIMWEHKQNNKPWETWLYQRGKDELFTGGWVSCCWVPNRDDAGWSENYMPKCNALKNGHLPEGKGWDLYRRVSELLLSPKRDDTGWSEKCMPRCNALENGHLPERKGWDLYRRVSDLVLSPREGWRREWEEWPQDRRRK